MTRRRLAIGVATVVIGACGATAAGAAEPTQADPLEREKLRQEIRQLELENRNAKGIRGFVISYAALATGAAAVGGVLVALFNLARQRKLDREQRVLESTRRLDERFTSVLADLGSDKEAVQAGAAVSLLTFLRPDQREYHRQVRLVALANLKVRKRDAISVLLVRVLEQALRTDQPLEPAEIDFSGAELSGANLSGLDLRTAKLQGARLADADLVGVNLWGVDAHKIVLDGACLKGADTDLREARFDEAQADGAVFHEANLSGAKFPRASLRGAKFESARLQSAHFERADLTGARFQNADLNDTFFAGATFDEPSLKKVLQARGRSFEKAHFSPDVDQQLKELDAARAHSKTPPHPDLGQRGVAEPT